MRDISFWCRYERRIPVRQHDYSRGDEQCNGSTELSYPPKAFPQPAVGR